MGKILDDLFKLWTPERIEALTSTEEAQALLEKIREADPERKLPRPKKLNTIVSTIKDARKKHCQELDFLGSSTPGKGEGSPTNKSVSVPFSKKRHKALTSQRKRHLDSDLDFSAKRRLPFDPKQDPTVASDRDPKADQQPLGVPPGGTDAGLLGPSLHTLSSNQAEVGPRPTLYEGSDGPLGRNMNVDMVSLMTLMESRMAEVARSSVLEALKASNITTYKHNPNHNHNNNPNANHNPNNNFNINPNINFNPNPNINFSTNSDSNTNNINTSVSTGNKSANRTSNRDVRTRAKEDTRTYLSGLFSSAGLSNPHLSPHDDSSDDEDNDPEKGDLNTAGDDTPFHHSSHQQQANLQFPHGQGQGNVNLQGLMSRTSRTLQGRYQRRDAPQIYRQVQMTSVLGPMARYVQNHNWRDTRNRYEAMAQAQIVDLLVDQFGEDALEKIDAAETATRRLEALTIADKTGDWSFASRMQEDELCSPLVNNITLHKASKFDSFMKSVETRTAQTGNNQTSTTSTRQRQSMQQRYPTKHASNEKSADRANRPITQ